MTWSQDPYAIHVTGELSLLNHWMTCIGSTSSDEAKITGMTFAMFSLMGR